MIQVITPKLSKMSKNIYISADYSDADGDRDVVDVLHQWADDNYHVIEFADTARVVSGSVSENPDCRPCDLKAEFNRQINASSIVIFVIGDKTADRSAGGSCRRSFEGRGCACTPYKKNANGTTVCKVDTTVDVGPYDDVGRINGYSYLKHEFQQAKKKGKSIVVVYNSLNKQPGWLPDYMSGYEAVAQPFWIRNDWGTKVGNYPLIKRLLGYD